MFKLASRYRIYWFGCGVQLIALQPRQEVRLIGVPSGLVGILHHTQVNPEVKAGHQGIVEDDRVKSLDGPSQTVPVYGGE
ncbi:hypothetical protein U1Q18_005362 [Sarracenia purpurea var. burkii]